MYKGSEQAFLQRRYTHGLEAHENMLNITGHEGNTNQKRNEIPLYPDQDGCIKKENKKCWHGCEEIQPFIPCCIDWEYKTVQLL